MLIDSLHGNAMPDNHVIPLGASALPRLPEELSCSEVVERAVARFGWPALLQSVNYVALRDGNTRLADAVAAIAEGEERQ